MTPFPLPRLLPFRLLPPSLFPSRMVPLWVGGLALLPCLAAAPQTAQAQQAAVGPQASLARQAPAGQTVGPQRVEIDAAAATTPFPHFWEHIFGSGRANLMLRKAYTEDLHAVHQATGMRYVRGHGILDDENGVYTEDEHGNPVYNFAYVDQIYDNLLAEGVKPVVELSFMPKKLAFNPDALHPFWYKPNVSPPRSPERWDGLITALARHLVEHYGIDEVSQWYFEVWNEPNIDFWNGVPRLESYLDLYAHTARSLKAVSPRLRVGGPATAAADWVPQFLAYTKAHDVPVDFVSSHGYADDTIENLFPAQPCPPACTPAQRPPLDTPMDDRVSLAIHKVRGQMDAAGYQGTPLFWTEWNVQGQSQSRDTTFVGPGLANTIREVDGAATEMSFWTFSDVFEEGGPIPRPFEGNFGLRAEYGINKPSFYDFALLHELGDRRMANAASNVLVTTGNAGTVSVALWNLVDPAPNGQPDPALTAPVRSVTLHFAHLPAEAGVTVQRVDNEHGNVLPVYQQMGSPQYPTAAQVAEMNRRTALPAPERTRLHHGELTLTLEPNALVVLHVDGHAH